jgi:hypothetical protein
MKNIQTFEQFISESTINEAYDFDKIAMDYQDNPYGIGASRVEMTGSDKKRILVFRHEDSRGRDQIIQKLKSMGVPANKITKSTQSKGYQYRYEANLFESEIFDTNED